MNRVLLVAASALALTAATSSPSPVAATTNSQGHVARGDVHVVEPGESIQAAVDVAEPGDTVSIQAGTYRESVLVTEDDITIRGAGSDPGGTLLLPPDEFPDDRCGTNPPAPEPPPYGAGICMFGDWEGPAGPTAHATRFLEGGHVTGMRIDGFAINIATVATDGVRVDDNVSLNAGHYGITHVLSKNGVVGNNIVLDAAHAGIYVGGYNIQDSSSTIIDNTVERSSLAISTYDSQGVTISRNVLRNNCVGYLAFADDLRVPGGDDLTVRRNIVVNNNQDPPGHGCEAVPRIDFPATNGSGIVLVGTTESTVSRNVVVGNVGDLPLSGGVVLVTGRNFGGGSGTDEGAVSVTRNVVVGNGPLDLSWDEVGEDITFADNHCGASSPDGLCGR